MMNWLVKSRPPKMRPTTGMMRSFTSESTILPKAAPMMTATARSTTLPLSAKLRKSLSIDIFDSPCLRQRRNRGRSALLRAASNRSFARFAGANAHNLLDRGDENLAIADLACARGLHDRLNSAIDERVGDDDLDRHLGKKIDHVLGAAV